ncbi:cupin domain-containing protein [Amycolatopsis viridis]|uniref:Mannose-6-phosphate isomerase-like protein (Cupin superfamily) n=1 Tax=Amycolatopsis viridis TaxID=185678 RepID=A0ABX0T473_9PSEU|nr:cupin domain-containing protein [Amycolatopsis viridis]NIH83017.1 mannose-6-phosphate isomerase-like protein (cupin superfamily) [Amycolatopsis viridis]
MLNKVVLADAFASFTDTWSPKVAADLHDMQVKLAKFEGEFVWHSHDQEDELFLVVDGKLRIDLRDGAVELSPGELVVIPHGVEHRPVALPTAQVVLMEPATTLNTGDAVDDARTVRNLDRLG